MRKITLFLVFVIVFALLLAAVIYSTGCQKSASTDTNTDTGTEQQSKTQTHDKQEADKKESAAEEVTVTIKSDGFDPQEVSVNAGGKVIWKNESGSNAQIHLDGGSPGETFGDGQTHEETFDAAGTVGYHNHLSQGMAGTVTIE